MVKVDFPKDADGETILRIHQAGSDLSRPMAIDIQILASSENVATLAQSRLNAAGFIVSKFYHDDTQDWDIIGTKQMILTYNAVLKLQEDVSSLLSDLDCEVDGWGSKGNSET